MISHLVDRQDATAHHFSFRVGEGGEDKSWTITKLDLAAQIERLEVLGLAWHSRNTDLFDPHEDIDDRTLADIGVSNGTNREPLIVFVLTIGSCLFLEPREKLPARENFGRAQLQVFVQSLIEPSLPSLGFQFISCLPLEFILETTVSFLNFSLDLFHILIFLIRLVLLFV